MAVSKRLRFEVLRRDQFRCRYCGLTAAAVELRVDHVIPEALGGTDEPSNLVAACEPCNSGKTSIAPDSPLVEQVAADAERWARAMEVVRAQRRQDRAEREEMMVAFAAVWPVRMQCALPSGWRQSIEQWLSAGLTVVDFDDLMHVANRRTGDTWRYFCGCCWARVRENASMAGDAIECGLAEPTAAARG